MSETRETFEHVQCANGGCTFFGRKETENMCSKCYKEFKESQAKDKGGDSAEVKLAASAAPNPPSSFVPPAAAAAAAALSLSSSHTCSGSSACLAAPTPPPAPLSAAVPAPASSPVEKEAAPAAVASPKKRKVQKNKKRCFCCRKKVGLTGIECRCGYVFCGIHRYPDQHECTFDFKAFDRAKIAKNNQKVVADKVVRF